MLKYTIKLLFFYYCKAIKNPLIVLVHYNVCFKKKKKAYCIVLTLSPDTPAGPDGPGIPGAP